MSLTYSDYTGDARLCDTATCGTDAAYTVVAGGTLSYLCFPCTLTAQTFYNLATRSQVREEAEAREETPDPMCLCQFGGKAACPVHMDPDSVFQHGKNMG